MGVNVNNLRQLNQQLRQSMTGAEYDQFVDKCAKELAARLLAKVINRTPVGEYPPSTGKMGGTLRRGWTGGADNSGVEYARSLQVMKSGNIYTIEIVNPVEYAQYVEYGHRTRGGTGWVEGRFMMTMSEDEIKGIAPRLLEQRLRDRLSEVIK